MSGPLLRSSMLRCNAHEGPPQGAKDKWEFNLGVTTNPQRNPGKGSQEHLGASRGVRKRLETGKVLGEG